MVEKQQKAPRAQEEGGLKQEWRRKWRQEGERGKERGHQGNCIEILAAAVHAGSFGGEYNKFPFYRGKG